MRMELEAFLARLHPGISYTFCPFLVNVNFGDVLAIAQVFLSTFASFQQSASSIRSKYENNCNDIKSWKKEIYRNLEENISVIYFGLRLKKYNYNYCLYLYHPTIKF